MQRHLFLAFSLFAFCASGKKVKTDLQWAICDPDPQTVLQKLGEDGTREPYKNNPITYYDTNPPSHSWDGLMFRTKTRHGEEVSAVKDRLPSGKSGAVTDFSRDDEVASIEERFNGSAPDTNERFLCVWDRYGEKLSFTCQITSPFRGRTELWTEEQILFAEHSQSVIWEELVGFGPYMNPKWRLDNFGHKAVFDDVQAGPLHLMELEVKVLKHQGDEVYDEITKYLKDRGVQLCHEQEGKTLRLFRAMGYGGDYHKMVKQFG